VRVASFENLGSRRLLVFLTLLGSLAILIFGLVESRVLENLWPNALAREAEALLGGAAVFILLCRISFGRFAALARYGVICAVGCGIAICFGLGPTLAGLGVALSCLICGNVVLTVAGCDIDDPFVAAVVGVSGTILLLVGAGIAHIPMIPVFWLFLGGMLACLAVWPKVRIRVIGQLTNWRSVENEPRWDLIETASAVLVLFELLYIGANAAMPERYYDPLAMHMMVPTQILTFGHWTYTPRLAFAFFPIGADYLFSYAMAMGGELAAKLINLLSLLLATALLYDIVRESHDRRFAWIAAALFLSIPVALIVSASMFVENMLCLLTVGAFRLLLMQRRITNRGALVGLAIVLPALAAIKLQGVLVAFAGTGVALWSQDYAVLRRRDWTAVGAVAVIAGGLGALTYIYAWAVTGNPVFPLMNNIFRSPFWPPVAFQDASYVGLLSPWLLYRMTFDTSTYLQAWPGGLGFVFMALLPAGLVAAILSPMRAVTIALIIAAFYVAIVLLEEQYIRYLYPVFPLLVLVCIHGMATLAVSHRSRIALGTCALALGLLSIYKFPASGWIMRDNDLQWLFDSTKWHDWLAGTVPERLANDLINAMATGHPHVLYACDAFGAFLHGTPVYTNWYNPQVQRQLSEARIPEQIRSVMDSEQIAFAVVNTASTQPVDRVVGTYAEQSGVFVAQIGRLRIYRIASGASQ
jgi:hypothetical protein